MLDGPDVFGANVHLYDIGQHKLESLCCESVDYCTSERQRGGNVA